MTHNLQVLSIRSSCRRTCDPLSKAVRHSCLHIRFWGRPPSDPPRLDFAGFGPLTSCLPGNFVDDKGRCKRPRGHIASNLLWIRPREPARFVVSTLSLSLSSSISPRWVRSVYASLASATVILWPGAILLQGETLPPLHPLPSRRL